MQSISCIHNANNKQNFLSVLQAIIVARSIKLMAKVNNLVTFLKLLSIVFIVVVGVAGIIIRRGVWKRKENVVIQA